VAVIEIIMIITIDSPPCNILWYLLYYLVYVDIHVNIPPERRNGVLCRAVYVVLRGVPLACAMTIGRVCQM